MIGTILVSFFDHLAAFEVSLHPLLIFLAVLLDNFGKMWKIHIDKNRPELNGAKSLDVSSVEGREIQSVGVGKKFIVAICSEFSVPEVVGGLENASYPKTRPILENGRFLNYGPKTMQKESRRVSASSLGRDGLLQGPETAHFGDSGYNHFGQDFEVVGSQNTFKTRARSFGSRKTPKPDRRRTRGPGKLKSQKVKNLGFISNQIDFNRSSNGGRELDRVKNELSGVQNDVEEIFIQNRRLQQKVNFLEDSLQKSSLKDIKTPPRVVNQHHSYPYRLNNPNFSSKLLYSSNPDILIEEPNLALNTPENISMYTKQPLNTLSHSGSGPIELQSLKLSQEQSQVVRDRFTDIIGRMELERSQLNLQLRQKSSEVDEKDKKLKNLEKRIFDLDQKNHDLSLENMNLGRENDELRVSIDQIQRINEQMRNNMNELESEISKISQIEALQKDYDEMCSKVEHYIGCLEGLTSENLEMKRKIEEMEKFENEAIELRKLVVRLEGEVRELGEARDENFGLTKEVLGLRDRVERVDEIDLNNEILRQDILELRSRVALAEAECQKAREMKADSDLEARDACKRVELSLKENMTLLRKIEALEEQVRELSRKNVKVSTKALRSPVFIKKVNFKETNFLQF